MKLALYLSAVLVTRTLLAPTLLAGEAEIVATLKDRGAQVQEQKGVVFNVSVADATAWTDADYALLQQLPGLKMLSFSKGFGDAGLKALGTLAELEYLQTNLMDVSDEGMKGFAQFPKLKQLKLFHPGKRLTGTGFAALSALPTLTQLTIAGSAEFGDEGMAAIATLSQVKELRTWHTGATVEGVKKLLAMKNLTSLTLGQRLTYAPPACVNDEAVEIIAQMTWLEALNIQEARLSMRALWKLVSLKELKQLTLDGIEINAADVELLKKQLPKVQVKWTKPEEKYKKRIDALTPP